MHTYQITDSFYLPQNNHGEYGGNGSRGLCGVRGSVDGYTVAVFGIFQQAVIEVVAGGGGDDTMQAFIAPFLLAAAPSSTGGGNPAYASWGAYPSSNPNFSTTGVGYEGPVDGITNMSWTA